jgi:hypothetical protein
MNFGELVDKILKTTNRSSDALVRTRTKDLIRQHYYTIAKRQSWYMMRQTVALDFTTAGAGGYLWLPSNLVEIDRVRDEDGMEYYPRDRHDVDPDDAGYRYATWRGAQEPLFRGVGSVANGASGFACDALTDDHAGYWVEFGTGEHFLLTGTKAFSPAYWGPAQTSGAPIIIRPIRTRVMALYDEDEELLIDRTVTVHYWALPPQLWKDEDEILLPDTGWLELSVFRDMPEAKERRPVNQRELDAAETKCLLLNPAFPRERQTRDRRNRPLSLDAGVFGVRR